MCYILLTITFDLICQISLILSQKLFGKRLLRVNGLKNIFLGFQVYLMPRAEHNETSLDLYKHITSSLFIIRVYYQLGPVIINSSIIQSVFQSSMIKLSRALLQNDQMCLYLFTRPYTESVKAMLCMRDT